MLLFIHVCLNGLPNSGGNSSFCGTEFFPWTFISQKSYIEYGCRQVALNVIEADLIFMV